MAKASKPKAKPVGFPKKPSAQNALKRAAELADAKKKIAAKR